MARALALAGVLVLASSCRDGSAPATASTPAPAPAPTLQSAEIEAPRAREPARKPEPEPRPVRVEDVDVDGDLTAFVVRAAAEHRMQMLFLPGMCVHPAGYAQSFQHAASGRGDLVAMQGDVSCGGDGVNRKWSSDLEAMDRRIDAAFRASGLGEPRNVVVIGYSQGAERAERLVARWPEKYDRALLIGSPVTPSPRTLGRARAVVLMAGTYDMATGPMRGAVGPLRRASVPATFLEIPEAQHGSMGDNAEATMDQALDFVESQ